MIVSESWEFLLTQGDPEETAWISVKNLIMAIPALSCEDCILFYILYIFNNNNTYYCLYHTMNILSIYHSWIHLIPTKITWNGYKQNANITNEKGSWVIEIKNLPKFKQLSSDGIGKYFCNFLAMLLLVNLWYKASFCVQLVKYILGKQKFSPYPLVSSGILLAFFKDLP